MHWQAYYNNGYILQNDSMAHQTYNNNEYALPISKAQGSNVFAKDIALSWVVEPERSWLNPKVRTWEHRGKYWKKKKCTEL